MTQAADRLEFMPPPTPGLMRALALALLAHLLLAAALTWGVNWKRDAHTPAVQAELWSSLPQEAAPREVEVAPEPSPAPAPAPVPTPPPAVKAPPPAAAVDIALARERERKDKERKEQELAREKEKRAQELREREQREKDRKLAEQKKKEAQAQQAKEARLKQQEEARIAKAREEQLSRIRGMADASGGPSATGSALKASGPSASYAGRIVARVRPNIVYTEEVSGNPVAEVEVRTAPDGTIVGRRLLKPSGHRAWDEAVLKAIDKTEVLPRDTDGRVPASLVIAFRPRD